jgi:hypothetical protein
MTSDDMSSIVYVYLLNEGTDVWRPVPATKLKENVYLLHGSEIFDPEDEDWEFLPGTKVFVKERLSDGAKILVAIAPSYD